MKIVTRDFFLRNVEIRVNGTIPQKAAILIANHDNSWDPPLIISASKKIVHFFTANVLFKNILKGSFLRLSEQIPVQSGKKTLNENGFSKASYYLKKNEPVGIFPYPVDLIKKKRVLYTGVIRMIIENDVPIIPIRVKISEARKSKSFYDVNFDKAFITIGKPLEGFREKCKKGMSEEYYLGLTKELMKHINSLEC